MAYLLNGPNRVNQPFAQDMISDCSMTIAKDKTQNRDSSLDGWLS